LNGDGCWVSCVEIEDRCFHTHGAAQAALELIIAEVLDEAGQIVAFGLRRPDNGFTFGASD